MSKILDDVTIFVEYAKTLFGVREDAILLCAASEGARPVHLGGETPPLRGNEKGTPSGPAPDCANVFTR